MSRKVKIILYIIVLMMISFMLISFNVSGMDAEDDIEICEWIDQNQYADLDPEKVILFAKLINSESHGENLVDKLLVGSVVMNRMKDTRWPGTMWSVVYDEGQFSGVPESKYFRYQMKDDEDDPGDAESIKAAMRLLKYGVVDSTIHYFLNPTIATDTTWMEIISKKKIRFVGKNHVFY